MNKLQPEAVTGFCGDGLWGMFTSVKKKKMVSYALIKLRQKRVEGVFTWDEWHAGL